MHPSAPRMPGALTRAALVALVAAVGLLIAGARPATAAGADAPWSVAPAANDFGSGRQNYGYTINPGGQLTDAFVVTNHGTTPLDLAVYAADGFTNPKGQFDLLAGGGTSKTVGAWVHPDRADVTVQAGASVEVSFTVTIPKDATPGDYLGGIVTSLTRTQADGTSVDRRAGIRVHLRVSGELTPRLAVENLRVDYSGKANLFGKRDATVTYTIRNTGNAILAGRQTVSLVSPFGHAQAGKIADSPQLLPGETWKVSVPVHAVTPAPRLTATVTVVPLLTDMAGSIAPLPTVHGKGHTWTYAWLLPLFVLLAAVAGLVTVLLRRRRRGPSTGQGGTPTAADESPAATAGADAEPDEDGAELRDGQRTEV